MDLNALKETLTTRGVEIGITIVGAIVAYIVGRWLIGFVVMLMKRAFTARKLDATLQRYLANIVRVILHIALVIAILGYFGIETTSFAALFAAAGVAIGMAWSGLLANFAAGVFLVVLRPIKVGDFVTAGGVTGTVREIGLFATVFDSPDNVETHLGNSKILGDTIQNFSANKYRRVDLKAQLDHTVDVEDAIKRLQEKIAMIPNVKKEPPPEIEILEYTLAGPVLAVRPCAHTDDYWQVYFAANRVIRQVGAEGEYAVPKQHLDVRDRVALAK